MKTTVRPVVVLLTFVACLLFTNNLWGEEPAPTSATAPSPAPQTSPAGGGESGSDWLSAARAVYEKGKEKIDEAVDQVKTRVVMNEVDKLQRAATDYNRQKQLEQERKELEGLANDPNTPEADRDAYRQMIELNKQGRTLADVQKAIDATTPKDAGTPAQGVGSTESTPATTATTDAGGGAGGSGTGSGGTGSGASSAAAGGTTTGPAEAGGAPAGGTAAEEPPPPEEPRSPSGYTRRQLENDNWNMDSIKDRLERTNEDLQQQMNESRNGEERKNLQEQIDKNNRELGEVNSRIAENNAELSGLPVEPQTRYTAEQLDNDIWNMGNLRDDVQRRIDQMTRDLEQSRDGDERRALAAEIQKQRRNLAGINDRIAEDQEMLTRTPRPPDDTAAEPPEEEPAGGAPDDSATIDGSGSGSGGGSTGGGSADTTAPDDTGGTGDTAGEEPSTGEGGTEGQDDQAESTPSDEDHSDAGDGLGDAEPGAEGSGSRSGENTLDTYVNGWTQEQQDRAQAGFDNMGAESTLANASTAGDAQLRDAAIAVNQAGAEAGQRGAESAAATAAGQRRTSTAAAVGDGIFAGANRGARSFVTTLGAAGADEVNRGLYGGGEGCTDSHAGSGQGSSGTSGGSGGSGGTCTDSESHHHADESSHSHSSGGSRSSGGAGPRSASTTGIAIGN